MATKLQPSSYDCYDHALDDEPMFVLLARDPNAPGVVRDWAYRRERSIARGEHPATDIAKVKEARLCAQQMEIWRMHNDGKWREHPELPLRAPAPTEAAQAAAS